jgi:hypothetical protein
MQNQQIRLVFSDAIEEEVEFLFGVVTRHRIIPLPLFYPTDEEEIRKIFVVMAKKIGAGLKPEDIPPIPQKGNLSGADIEGLIGRAWRVSLLEGSREVTRKNLEEVVTGFMPSTQTLERELQERLNAIKQIIKDK